MKPTVDWTISITLREDLNTTSETLGHQALDEETIRAGLRDFLTMPNGIGVTVEKCEVRGPLMVKKPKKVLEYSKCKLRQPLGSEEGTCECATPDDCPSPPNVTAMGERLKRTLEGKDHVN